MHAIDGEVPSGPVEDSPRHLSADLFAMAINFSPRDTSYQEMCLHRQFLTRNKRQSSSCVDCIYIVAIFHRYIINLRNIVWYTFQAIFTNWFESQSSPDFTINSVFVSSGISFKILFGTIESKRDAEISSALSNSSFSYEFCTVLIKFE